MNRFSLPWTMLAAFLAAAPGPSIAQPAAAKQPLSHEALFLMERVGSPAVSRDRKDAKSKVRIYDSFPIRRWDRWLDDTQTHLFAVPAAGGAARDLLAGTRLVSLPGFAGATGEGSGDSLEPAWAPDGKSIVFVA